MARGAWSVERRALRPGGSHDCFALRFTLDARRSTRSRECPTRLRTTCLLSALYILSAHPLHAQWVNGSADWSFARSAFESGSTRTVNHSFAQNYALSYQSIIWDPRFLQYTAGLDFQKTGLTLADKKGGASNTGFNLSANLFPARPFPLSIYARRSYGSEFGDFPSSGVVRGGIPLPPGAAYPDVKLRMTSFGLNWSLDSERLPKIEVAYRKDGATAAADVYKSTQKNRTLNVTATKEGARSRSTLRYQRQGFDNLITEALKTRYNDLSYELITTLNKRTKGSMKAGMLDSYSLFDTPRQGTEIGGGPYQPPSKGGFRLYYATANMSYQTTKKLLTSFTASYDRGQSDVGSSHSLLFSATNSYTPLPMLNLHGNATYGLRGQVTDDRNVSARTSSLGGGAVVNVPLKLVLVGFGVDYSKGRNQSDSGVSGRTSSWTATANASTSALKVVSLTADYERGRSTDELLSFGNYAIDRVRASAHSQAIWRTRAEVNWEQAKTLRGAVGGLGNNRSQVVSGEIHIDLGRMRRVSLTVGRFLNRTEAALDRTSYYGVDFEAYMFRALRVSFTARRETYQLEKYLSQDGLRLITQLEYRLRAFTFGFEHRYSTLDQALYSRESPLSFYGNQVLFRVSRKFGFLL